MGREWRRSSDTSYIVCDGCGVSYNVTDDDARACGWSIDYPFDGEERSHVATCPECAS